MGQSGAGADRKVTAGLRFAQLPALWFAVLIGGGCGPRDTGGSGAENGDGSERTPEEILADSLIGRWTETAGGVEAWGAVRSARYTINTVLYDSLEAVRWMRPRRVKMRKTSRGEEARIERPEAEGLYVQVFTGDTAWATLNGRPLSLEDPAAAEAEYVARDVVYWFGLPYKLWDPGVNRRARRTDDGYEVAVTFGSEVGAHPGDRYFYYFNDRDPFPEEVHYIEEGKENRSRTVWADFRVADPLTYVGVRKWYADGRLTKELRIDDVGINPELADSLFTSPGS
jgi:hypothetical protein